MKKRALIFGISGQDGAYLAKLLAGKDYEVHGTSRDAELQRFERLDAVGVRGDVTVHSASLVDFRNLLQLIAAVRPDEIYNLAGQSSVALSFHQPMETMESVAQGTMRILEVIRFLKLDTRFYNATTSECFGEIPLGTACDESTPLNPRSPYAIAKAAAHWSTVNYREAYGMYACCGILFNHESPLRSPRFLTRKVTEAAVAIARGAKETLELGELDVWRDWGYAPEYVDAMWRMLQRDTPEDFVIATGESHTVEELVAAIFEEAGVDWHGHVTSTRSLYRPSEIHYTRGNPSKAKQVLGWEATTRFRELVHLLVVAERERLRR